MRIITSLILHHTAIPLSRMRKQADHIDSVHYRKWWSQIPRGMAYHRLIDGDNTVAKGRPWWTIGYHSGNRQYNLTGMGIGVSGDFTQEEVSGKQLNLLAREVIDICTRHRIRWQNVKNHFDVRNTECPGKDFRYFLFSSGKLAREHKRKLAILRKSLGRANVAPWSVGRAWMIRRKIAFLETQFYS